MKLRNYRYLAVLISGFILTIAAYLLFLHSPLFPQFKEWTYRNIFILDLSLVSIKIIGIIWPPLPGLVLTVGAIPIVGWFHAFIIDTIGNIIGSTLAYLIARKWGIKFINKIFNKAILEKMESIKTVEKRELEAILIFRVLGGGLTELISYAAGLYKVKFKNFILGVVLSNFIVGIPLFYLANRVFEGKNFLFTFLPLAVAITLFITLRKRYFEPIYKKDIT